MEENKIINGTNKEQGENIGRKRRKKPRPNGGEGQSHKQAASQDQNQNQGKAQQKQKQNGQKPQQKQNGQKQEKQEKQSAQNNANGQGKKNKNKGQPQKQQPQKNQNANKNQQSAKVTKEENRKDTYLYVIDGTLYVNLTNKCSNACDFCVRNERTSYYGHYLWLRHGDPTVEKVVQASKQFGDLSFLKEAVFCGFGEPTYKVAEMIALCDFFHEKGLKTRLNTNGQGNLINKRDIVPDLKGKIDFVNISLNASCYEKYQPICRSQFRESGFEGMIEFAKLCRCNGVQCRFSIVDCIGEAEVEACKRLADSLKIPLYVRSYITDS
ncbi:MAG: radical SAM protein [Clostridia bacterium]|nr:radical SAM protein [Clostridia bacterium]